MTELTSAPPPARSSVSRIVPRSSDADPARADDDRYLEDVNDEVEGAIRSGMDRLAERRRFPVFF